MLSFPLLLPQGRGLTHTACGFSSDAAAGAPRINPPLASFSSSAAAGAPRINPPLASFSSDAAAGAIKAQKAIRENALRFPSLFLSHQGLMCASAQRPLCNKKKTTPHRCRPNCLLGFELFPRIELGTSSLPRKQVKFIIFT